MRTRRFLLTATALIACKQQQPKQLLHGNPKGSFYDAGQVVDAPPADTDEQPLPEATVDAPVDAPVDAGAPEKTKPRLPANPKGSHYDKGLFDPLKK